MDLHFSSARPSEQERAAVEDAVGKRSGRHLLLPVLRAVQQRIGWISEGAANEVGRRLDVPPAEVFGVASFYALLATSPRPPRVAHVCDDIACRLANAERLCDELSRRVGPAGAPDATGAATWHRSPCLGHCERGPAVLFQLAGDRDATMAPASADAVADVLGGAPVPAARVVSTPQTKQDGADLRLLSRTGRRRRDGLEAYRDDGGFRALARAIELGPRRVVDEIVESGLVGRGGAAFPCGRKWQAVADAASRPHYVVCNADESEPGTFKDRVLMEDDPFAVIEATTIAGLTVGAERGYLYVRGEYPLAAERLERGISAARAAGLLGSDILASGRAFDIEMRLGGGAYICGEETALFNSIEGYRGEPRNKPPYPTERGLFGRPTLVNNVETLVNVLPIVLDGGARYAATGTPGSTGPKLFCVSGSVRHPGLYEVAFGATIADIVALAGGVPDGRRVRAVLLGGAAGAFVGPDGMDLPLTFEDTRAAGASVGSGVVMVFDDRADMTATVLRIADFFKDESCGQCVPCRVGTMRQAELLRRLVSDEQRRPAGVAASTAADAAGTAALLGDLARVMADASICGLGHTAAVAAQSALALGLLEPDRGSG